jgi:two-component system, OmpR family, phosphate regulon sensor histidine kinase PhoR
MIHILVIDDDRHMRIACSRVLSKAGWLAICAETGDEGLQQLRIGVQNFDVVLMDQQMPGLMGMDALAKIHAIDPNLPVIIMTGSATDESAIEIIEQGAFDCLPKPFTPEQLRKAILRAVEKGVG